MEPVLSDSIITGKRWIHQVKWDGIRGLCYIHDKQVHLYTRSGRERTLWYPEISGIDTMMSCKQAVLDGELIVPDAQGKPSFHQVMSRERIKRKDTLEQYQKEYPVHYMVFDILFKNGQDLRQIPLKNRKEILNEILQSDYRIQVVSDYTNSKALFSFMKEKGMEGIVSKNVDSRYTAGKKHKDWFKTKIVKQILAVVCGVKMKEDEIRSLALGIYENGSLYQIGSVSSGLSQRDRRVLREALPHLRGDPKLSETEKTQKDMIWIKPVLTVVVRYLERESGGRLRHPVLIGFSSRKPSEAMGEEEPV